MKIFNCDCCGAPVFFENVRCLQCGCTLAFLPDRLEMASIQPCADDPSLWVRTGSQATAQRYRLCHNHGAYQACNFTVRAEDPNGLCLSCRQTRVLPDLSDPANVQRWFHIEQAKRRLYYTLARMGLAPTGSVLGEQQAPVYEFLEDLPGQPRVMTGHNNGLITLNVAEADDDERARRRLLLHEPYRTLLGHLRHESGHYYWDRLIRDGGRTEPFRAVFGDESFDYGEALSRYYARGPVDQSEWQSAYVSTYATAHPWEDWAETWAHYLHMVDLLETAAAYHTKVEVPGAPSPAADEVTNPFDPQRRDFDELVAQWIPVTLMLNSLNRSLGQSDAYPFALSPGALHKLRFVHDVICEAGSAVPPYEATPPAAAAADAAGAASEVPAEP